MAPQAPAGVHDVFAPIERTCGSCGAHSLTARRTCPACGAPYVAWRVKPLGTRRRRMVLLGSLTVLIALVLAGVAVLSPGINRARHAHQLALQRAAAAARAGLIARESAQQRLQLATGRARDPGLGAAQARRLAVRTALVRELESAITSDARARVRAGIFTGPILFTSCSSYPGDTPPPQTTLGVAVGGYSCVAVNREIRNVTGPVGELGDPFWARIDFAHARLAWCKINPRPGEQAINGAAPSVPLAPACDLSLPAPASLR